MDIKITIKNKGNVLANAHIMLDTIDFGLVTIKNFTVWKSPQFNDRLQEAINITPPQNKHGFKYVPIVFFETKDRWYELEQQIYDAFNAKRNRSNNEDIDLDEVDTGIAKQQEENKNNDY